MITGGRGDEMPALTPPPHNALGLLIEQFLKELVCVTLMEWLLT